MMLIIYHESSRGAKKGHMQADSTGKGKGGGGGASGKFMNCGSSFIAS